MLGTNQSINGSTSTDPQAKPSSRNQTGQRPRVKRLKSSTERTGLGPDTDDSNGCCSRCNTIDLSLLQDASVQIPESGTHVAALGRPSTNAFQAGCPSCNLFLSVATNYKRKHDLELRCFDRIPIQNPVDRLSLPNVEDRFLAVVRHNKRLVYDYRISHEIGSNGILVAGPPQKSMCRVQLVDPVNIDFNLVKSWLDHCTSVHLSTCNPANNDISDLQLHVIDCQENSIRLLPANEEYVALSYVWGQVSGSKRFDVSADEILGMSLSSYNVPRTITDAIQVVRNLKRRYLWVDRYCIPHTDAARRADAILNMNQIYAVAVLTIVALSGENSDAGLPGVSSRRLGNQAATTKGSRIISSLPPLTSMIKRSKWSTRGWTFQEARLSRRCLFISESQAYFSCQAETVSESLPEFSSSFPAANHLSPGGLNPAMFAPSSNLMFSGLFLDRLSYTQRSLTYPNDVLDAFRGILRLHLFVTLWGVPVSHTEWNIDPLVIFTMGLLWARRSLATFEAHMPDTHTGSYERRPGYPTWSWVSIVGEVFQFGTNETCIYRQFFCSEGNGTSEQPRASIAVRVKASGISLSDTVTSRITDLLPELSPSILITGDLIRVKRDRDPTIKPGKVGHIRYRFCGEDDKVMSDVYILPRIDLDEDDKDTSEAQDALVLIDWRDGAKKSQRRFILMLLKWVEDGVAERIGLLGRYYEKWNVSFLDRLWRRKMDFELR